MVYALQGDKCYVNTRYFNMFFSDGGWGKIVARH